MLFDATQTPERQMSRKHQIKWLSFCSVEDMASLAEVTSLIEVSLDGNPVALGGDCTPFLVSYLPNLLTLTNMHVTEQVKRFFNSYFFLYDLSTGDV